MIYPNLEEARAACTRFAETVNRMQHEMGIHLEIDDSCVSSWWTARYYDTDGVTIRTYFYD